MTNAAVSESAIFKAAAVLPPEQRVAYLNQACGDDVELRHEVESLLAAHKPDASFMDSLAEGITIARPIAERPGNVIGAYKLLQQIGEGGMGVVFMAEQEHPVRRRVALKIIKPGMDSRQVIARFEAERQALAMMDHQNIARVLDAGTTDSGRPFFVMELVHGVPLTKFCDDNRLTLQERLELFVPVCQAIQHAHQKGVIHRDVKPGNILVTMYDDKPVPKVIDFGVAKAIEQRLTEKTLFTQYGTLVGTFEYMSPEQAEMNAFGVDTRSDIYSLGVLLYELLTGTTPLERSKLRDAALTELVRLIREEEPPRPSIRLSTSGGLPKFAAACRTQPAQLPNLVRGELDWIVMKCLEKDRTRRYETANGLARDVQRYLNDEPIEACPPSPLYRLQKLARRYRALLFTAACFVTLLGVASMVSTALATWAVRAQREAQASLTNERMARQEAVEARNRADQAAQRLRTAVQHASDGIAYYQRSNWSAAHASLSKATEIEPALNTSYIQRGALYVSLGLWDRAAADYDRRFQLANRADVETCFEHALLKLYTGDETGYRHACEELVRQHGKSADIGSRYAVLRCCLLAPQPVGVPADLLQRAESLMASANAPWIVGLVGRAFVKAGNYEQAEARCREALKLGTGSPTGVHRVNFVNLAIALKLQGKQSEAEEALIRFEQARDGWITTMLDGFADTMPFNWRDWVECSITYREAKILITGSPPIDDLRLIALDERGLAAITYDDVFALMDAGREQVQRQAWDVAAAKFVEVLDQLSPGFRASSQEMRFCAEMVQQPEVFATLVKLRPDDAVLWCARGRTLASGRQWKEAVAHYSKSLELLKRGIDRADPTSKTGVQIARAVTAHELAALKLLAEDRSGYLDLCTAIVKEQDSVEVGFVASGLARACTLAPDAVSDWSVPLKLAQQAVTKEPNVAWHLYALGIAQHRAGQQAESVQTLKKSLEIAPNWLGRSQNHAALALAYHQLGQREDARQSLRQAEKSLNQTIRTMAASKFGFAASYIFSDWLCTQILLAEAKASFGSENTP